MKHYCDYCHNRIEEPNEEVSIAILELPWGDIYFFHSEDCLWGFINENTTWGYINDKGAILKDGE